MYCIYMHINKINQKVYIGQTKNKPEKRWGLNGQNYTKCPRFYNIIKKYGWENFEHIILEEGLTAEEANQKEKEYIEKFQSNNELFGYNLTSGGNNGTMELWNNPEWKAQIIQQRKQAFQDITYKNARLKPMLDGIQRVWSDPEWRKQRIANITGEKNPNSKKVKNLETGIVFNTITEAAHWAGLKAISGIGQCCRGQRKTSGKHPETNVPLHWCFVEEVD